MPDNNNENINPHKSHRKRLKNRFINEGLENFEKHNALELLLFYSIPRKDTNDIAHELMEHYNSFAAIFDADYDDLIRQKNITENTAVLIKLIPAIAKMYRMDKKGRYLLFNNVEDIGKFLVDYYFGYTREVMVAVLLNNNFEMIECVKIAEGSVNSASITFRKIAEIGLAKQAASFILAHNHPDGSLIPSEQDKLLTMNIKSTFEGINFPMIEHYIIAGEYYTTILHELRHPYVPFTEADI